MKPLDSGTIALSSGDETYVYRAYCQCGDLLYVGVARNLFNRQASHARDGSAWERRAVRLEWELYPTRRAALAVEADTIVREEPPYNIAGRSRTRRTPKWRPLPELKPPPPFEGKLNTDLAVLRGAGYRAV